MNPYILPPNLNGNGLRIGIVRSRSNEKFVQMALECCVLELINFGVSEDNIVIATVPSTVELGVALLHMAETFEFDSLIALGTILRSETYKLDKLANEIARFISSITLQTGIPIANGVCTIDSSYEDTNRLSQEGKKCAQIAIEMANLITALEPVEKDKEDKFDD